jgi:SGNH hydrolase-like domain, acetyltransferase AlgX
MLNREQPLPAGGHGSEESAKIEVGHTTVAPGLARWLVASFLLAIAVVPIIEVFGARSSGTDQQGATWSQFAGLPQAVRSQLIGAAREMTVWRRIVSANREVLSRLSGFERALENRSLLGRTLRRPAQRVMAGWLGTGNERVYVGRDGWLFYRSDVESITGRGFLDSAQLERRVEGASEWTAAPQPDPRPAIVQLHRDLQARGIQLIVMPTPLKPGVHPEMLAAAAASGAVLQNRSYSAFVEDLTRAGILVFDPAMSLASARAASPQYLKTDTHWLPETMEGVAELLGVFIDSRVRLPASSRAAVAQGFNPAPDADYRVERVEVRNLGDTARMLDLPENDPLFPPEAVWVRRILHPDGSLWRSSRAADVLLLGDSFSNIYSLESLGWGSSAGFAEQLSYVLRRPVDRLMQNDQGAFATRAMLQRDPGRLVGKRVVIYQFAARELTIGDWKILSSETR